MISKRGGVGGGGQNGARVSERRRRSKAAATMEPETTQHNSPDRLQTRKKISTTLLFKSEATFKPIRLECCRPPTADSLAPIEWVSFEPTVWPDTYSLNRIRVLLQWTQRI
jgi:hypothetical protein